MTQNPKKKMPAVGPKTVFRLLIMIACSAGVAYGASQIGQLPEGPREMVGRIGKWLQAQADVPAPDGQKADVPIVDAPVVGMPVADSLVTEGLTPEIMASGPLSGLPSTVSSPQSPASVSSPHFPASMADMGDRPVVSMPPLAGATAASAAEMVTPIGQNGPVDVAAGQSGQGGAELAALAFRLRELGATRYQLENWGGDERLFRFTCEVAVGGESGLRQHFEAVDNSGTEAVRRVVGQVSRLSQTR